MRNLRTIRTPFRRAFAFIVGLFILINCKPARAEEKTEEQPAKSQSIMLALLLDTSNSMDGLIDQAKSQLWKIVNDLSQAKCSDGSRPSIKIALYEYGNDRLSAQEGYIRQVSPLTDDLDVISEKLFALTTNGGEEYCGHVIRTSLNQLAWTTSNADLKMIFIAGNEPFTQGGVPYSTACALAKEKGVVVNTIFCGDFTEGLNTDWKSGATLAGGTYMSIQQDRKTVYIPTPYDKEIDAMNDRLNNTYVYYGKSGADKKSRQLAEDENAQHYGQSNKVERAVSKSSHAYKNSSWDMVDAAKDDANVITEAREEDLPAEMKNLSVEQRKVYVQKKSEERTKIQNEIQSLSKKRMEYISTHTPSTDKDTMLDAAMIKAVRQRAAEKDLKWQ